MRKKLLSAIVTLTMIAALFVPMAHMQVMAAQKLVLPDTGSYDYNFNADWKFTKPYGESWPLEAAVASTADSNGNRFYEVGYDDASWESVSVPHTFNDTDSFKNVANDMGDVGSYRGIAFYRKSFDVPTGDKKYIIEFEGVRQAAYVYVNGTLAGYYENGVAPFGMDITKYVNYGEENLIAVAVDNTSARGMVECIAETRPGSVPGSNDGDAFQWNTKDFNPDMGGLTRNVIMHVKNDIYETLPLYSNLRTKGTYVYAENINPVKGSADITVETEIRNESDKTVSARLKAYITDKDENVVAELTSNEVTINAAGDKERNYDLSIVPADAYDAEPAPTDTKSLETTVIAVSAKVEDLNLWSPDAPYLYDVYTVLEVDGGAVDTHKTTTGFRKAELKSGGDGGMYINDKYVWLTGYAQRSTNEWAAIGVAPDWLKDYDMQLLKESNANFVRWMHIAAQPSDIRSADRYGVVCVQPAGDKEKDSAGRQWDQRMEVMRDVLIYFRNSPSIMFWEAGNNAVSAEHMKEMTALKNELDPKGMRSMGARSLSDQAAVDEAEYVGTMLGRNVFDGREYTENGYEILSKRGIVETEYHREEAPRRVWDDFSPPDFDYVNSYSGGSKISHKDAHDLTSEDFVRSDAREYNTYFSRRAGTNSAEPFYSTAAALCWTDSNQHARQQATENCRTSGRVDPVRVKKQSFYAYRVMQSSEPDIHIVGHWNYPEDSAAYVYKVRDNQTFEYTGETALRDPKNKTVYVVASGCASVELFVNDMSAGKDSEPEDGFIYAFDGIDITKHGNIVAVGYDGAGNETARHKIVTAGEPAQIRLTPVTGPEGLIADGSDVAYIDVEIVDAQGNVCPLDYDRIDFEVSGDCEFLGGYNSGVGDIDHSSSYIYAECGVNRVFIRASRNAGDITVTAKRAGLAAAQVTLTSVPFDNNGGMTLKFPQRNTDGEIKTVAVVKEAVPMRSFSDMFSVKFGVNTKNETHKNVSSDVKVYVNGMEIDCGAYMMTGVYGKIEPVLAALGVEYTVADGVLKANYNGTEIITSVKNSEMIVNGEPSIINDWPEIKDGQLYAEISAIIPNLGISVASGDGTYHINGGAQ